MSEVVCYYTRSFAHLKLFIFEIISAVFFIYRNIYHMYILANYAHVYHPFSLSLYIAVSFIYNILASYSSQSQFFLIPVSLSPSLLCDSILLLAVPFRLYTCSIPDFSLLFLYSMKSEINGLFHIRSHSSHVEKTMK